MSLYRNMEPPRMVNTDVAFVIISFTLTLFPGVTVLLSLTVFQDSVSATMPITSLQIPLLGKLVRNRIAKMRALNNHLFK